MTEPKKSKFTTLKKAATAIFSMVLSFAAGAGAFSGFSYAEKYMQNVAKLVRDLDTKPQYHGTVE